MSSHRPHPSAAPQTSYREVTPAELARAHFSGRIVDVREPDEFDGELGHLERAELVPLAGLLSHASRWNRDEEIVLVCRSGRRSAHAAAQLAQLGFRRVFNLTGGMLAQREAGLPSVRGAARSAR